MNAVYNRHRWLRRTTYSVTNSGPQSHTLQKDARLTRFVYQTGTAAIYLLRGSDLDPGSDSVAAALFSAVLLSPGDTWEVPCSFSGDTSELPDNIGMIGADGTTVVLLVEEYQ